VTDPSLNQPDAIEQLVAYLDGELAGDQAAVMEQRLRQDSELRQQAEQLDRTWGMLDVLEPVAASEQFSLQTMETVVATYSRPTQQATLSPRRIATAFLNRQAVGWFVVGVLGTVVGLGLSGMRGPSEESAQAMRLLRELDMLDRYPQYSIVPDVDSLESLQLPDENSVQPETEE